jgi:hypothetical protein
VKTEGHQFSDPTTRKDKDSANIHIGPGLGQVTVRLQD